jgi:isopenicillin N synthase-like dioxygenase
MSRTIGWRNPPYPPLSSEGTIRSMSDVVPVIDLSRWFHGDDADRSRVGEEVDEAFQQSGFMLVRGHGVPPDAAADMRRLAREFFALPSEVKTRYKASPANGRGWLPPGAEANAYSEGTESPPDLKESLSYGADLATGMDEVDRIWFQPNPLPVEVLGLSEAITSYMGVMHTLADQLMEVCALALGLPRAFFAEMTDHPTYTFNTNWYPALTAVGPPAEGQFRIGPHTDFGTLTLLDREPGAGGLQVFTRDGEWIDAPYEPGTLTVNIGDLLARWTGDRWLSARHRVLPPQSSAPDEELVSLVFFYETNYDALIESLAPPVGYKHYTPVYAGDYLLEKYTAIAID